MYFLEGKTPTRNELRALKKITGNKEVKPQNIFKIQRNNPSQPVDNQTRAIEQIGDVPSTSAKIRRHKKRKRKQSKQVSPVETGLIPNTPCNDDPWTVAEPQSAKKRKRRRRRKRKHAKNIPTGIGICILK